MVSVLADKGAVELPITAQDPLDYGGASERIEAEVTSPNCQYTARGRAT